MTITHRSQSTTSIQRDSWLEINLSALERNYKKLRELLKTDIMAIVKADAYGHGATVISPILQSMGIHSFGVATVDEGIALRESGIQVPIVILGATPFWANESCIRNNLTLTIYSPEQISQLKELLNKSDYKKMKLSVHLKIDTGMNRLGIPYQEATQIIRTVLNSENLKLEGIFTHLADATNYNFSKIQKERFDSAVANFKDLKAIKHIANSYAAINYLEFRHDLVRIGIALYGQEFNFLEPIISLKGRITEIHKILKDESVSYERTWIANHDSTIATVPIGYADGVDRQLSNNIYALYNKDKIPQVGTITMDQMMFDVSKVRNPKVNDVITLLGNEIPISLWAEELNTITYELTCRLKMRLPRIYIRD